MTPTSNEPRRPNLMVVNNGVYFSNMFWYPSNSLNIGITYLGKSRFVAVMKPAHQSKATYWQFL